MLVVGALTMGIGAIVGPRLRCFGSGCTESTPRRSTRSAA